MPGSVLNQLASLPTDNGHPAVIVTSGGTYGTLERSHHARRLVREPFTVSQWVLSTLGAITVVGLLYAITLQRTGTFADPYKHLAVITVLLMTLIYRSAGVYREVMGDSAGLLLLTRAWLVTVAMLLAIGLVTDTASAYSRKCFVYWSVSALFAQYALSLLAHGAFRLWQEYLKINLPTVVIGSGPLAAHLIAAINRNPLLPEHVIGLLDESNGSSLCAGSGVPVLGSIDDLDRVLARQPIDRAYIA